MNRVCKKCNITKQLTEFYDDGHKRGWLNYTCKICMCEYRRNQYKNNPTRFKTACRNWQQKNREKWALYQKNYRIKNLETMRENDKKKYYKNRFQLLMYSQLINLDRRSNYE